MSDNKAKKFLIKIPIEEKIGIEQKGKIKVGSQILRQLSKGVYSTPEMALKELISNAFDADAPKVTISSKKSSNSIIIHDNGVGMDYHDFDENFTYISKSPKVGKDEVTPIFKRPVIGRLGIGFIAVSALCNTMIVSSTTKESKTKFIATIDFSRYKRRENEATDFYEISDYTITNYRKSGDEGSYTHIELRDLEPAFRNVIENRPEKDAHAKNFTDPDFEKIVKKVWNTPRHIEISKTYGPYWRFIMNLASIIPVEYMKDGPIKSKKYEDMINPFKEQAKKLNFKVIFDGMNLKKPYLFPTKQAAETGNFTVLPFKDEIEISGAGKVSYDGYIYSQQSGIFVDDWRGLVVRVKNTSIGTIFQNFLDYPYEGDSLYFKWTFGEIYVREGLEEAMNIDRATFKKSDPEYDQFVRSIHHKLRSVAFESVQHRWREKVKKEQRKLKDYKEKWRKSSLTRVFNKDFEIKESQANSNKIVEISLEDRTVELNPYHKILDKFPRKERELLKDVILAAAIARKKFPDNANRQESLFIELLEDLARRYPKPTLKFEYQKRKK